MCRDHGTTDAAGNNDQPPDGTPGVHTEAGQPHTNNLHNLTPNLIQSVPDRPFRIRRRTAHNQQLLVLEFPRGIRVLMSAGNTNRPLTGGITLIQVYRKYLPAMHQVLHWISIISPALQTRISAQIMATGRLEAACEITQRGGYACFASTPFQEYRQSQSG